MVGLGCCTAIYVKRDTKAFETLLDDVMVTVNHILWSDAFLAGTLCNGYAVLVATAYEEYILTF